MAYIEFLKNINQKFQQKFSEIESHHNFELGNEFEIAVCKVLRALLPTKFGICRGYVTNSEGIMKGDDIIIYDRERFPLLRLLENDNFEQKQYVPVEAVYAYIEAKNTLYINSDGGQSLDKAVNQVCEVINIQRQALIDHVSPQVKVPSGMFRVVDGFPKLQNPFYGVVIARNIRVNDKTQSTSIECLKALENFRPLDAKYNNYPSLIIAGEDIICFPVLTDGNNLTYRSPFFIKDKSTLLPSIVEGQAFGLGMVFLLNALESIMLGKINWAYIISQALNVTYSESDDTKL